MTNGRAKAAATATVLGLGALGGVAMATNQGLPAQAGGAKTASVVTGASSTGAATTTAAGESGSSHRPIVTRASGAAGGLAPTDD